MNIIFYKQNSSKNISNDMSNNIISNLNENFLNNHWIMYNRTIYLLYDCKTEINPPFFTNIIISRDDLKITDLKMIYNMSLVGASIIFLKKYSFFFQNNKPFKKSKYLFFTKQNNYVHNDIYNRVIDFIIMGTQKGGTTALALNIAKHPDIYIDNNPDPQKSEVHYFDINWSKGINWYKNQFDYSKKLVGEKTPDLMYLPYTFPYIQRINPYIKIIIILRDPIERAYSSWKLMKQSFGENRTFQQAIQDELNNNISNNITFFTSNIHYLQKGLYFNQINYLLKWFSKDNILILISEIVKNNMNVEYNKIFSFLNINNISIEFTQEFISDDKSLINNSLYNQLIPYFKKDVNNLEKILGFKLNWLKKKK
jgi:hypothetical protein